MPNLQRLGVAQARTLLLESTKSELIVTNRPQADSLGASGVVVEQQPLAGQAIIPGRSASVLIGVQVPQVVGRTTAQATQLIKPLLLQLATNPSVASPDEVIATQAPAAGTLAAPETSVHVSFWPKMPDLIGQSPTVARQSLQDAHVTVPLSVENASDAAKLGHAAVVVSQSPGVGAAAPGEGSVRIQVGALVPDLRARPVALAREEAATLLFVLDALGIVPTDAAGVIADQEPNPGVPKPPGTHIELAFRVTVPHLQGLTSAQAREAAAARGLALDQVAPAEPSEVVAWQQPDAGATVALGSRIEVRLATWGDGAPDSSTGGNSTSEPSDTTTSPGGRHSPGWLWLLGLPVLAVVGFLLRRLVRETPKPVVSVTPTPGQGVFSLREGERSVTSVVRTTVAFNVQGYSIAWDDPAQAHVRVARIHD